MGGLAPARSRGGRKSRKGRGKGVIWSKRRLRRVNGKPSRGALQQTFSVKRDLAYDVDVKPIVAVISQELAEYFRDQLEAGDRPQGNRLDRVLATTEAIEPRKGSQMGLRSGYGAERWWQGKLKGTFIKAERNIKPYGGRDGPKPAKASGFERDQMLNVLLKRGFDFQAVDGKAAALIGRVFAKLLPSTVGEDPGLPKPRKGQGTLRDFG